MSNTIIPDLLAKLEASAKAALNAGAQMPFRPSLELWDAYRTVATPDRILALIAAVREARERAIDECAAVMQALHRAMPPAAKCSWNGACESGLVAIESLKSKPSGDV